jgi:hypothetical protein
MPLSKSENLFSKVFSSPDLAIVRSNKLMLRSRVVRPNILVASGEARPSKYPPQYGGIFYR